MAKKWGPGNPLWEWQQKHKRKGKIYKSPSRHKSIVRHMARRGKKHHRRRGGFTIPIAPTLGLVGAITSPVISGENPFGALEAKDYGRFISLEVEKFCGYSPITNDFKFERMIPGLGPIVTGLLVHKFVGGSLGFNSMLARNKIPFIRV